MNTILVAKVLCLLAAANGAPVIARKLFGDRFSWPVDGGRTLYDGRPVFGRSKTVRGIVVSVAATVLGAVALGIPARTGLAFAAASMAGDLLSSFIKRRLGMAPSSMALGLDQLPESVLPLIICWQVLGLTLADAVAIVVGFFVGELLLSRLLYRLHLRDRPY
jgi:CDP-2,3-bis-(O-geranylgeranyl)-sn-glycerol synthase